MFLIFHQITNKISFLLSKRSIIHLESIDAGNNSPLEIEKIEIDKSFSKCVRAMKFLAISFARHACFPSIAKTSINNIGCKVLILALRGIPGITIKVHAKCKPHIPSILSTYMFVPHQSQVM